MNSGNLSFSEINNMSNTHLSYLVIRVRTDASNYVGYLQRKYPSNMTNNNINFDNLSYKQLKQVNRRIRGIIKLELDRSNLINELQSRGSVKDFNYDTKPTRFIKALHSAQQPSQQDSSAGSSSANKVEDLYSDKSPMDQFEIRSLFNIDAPILGDVFLSITNIALYLTIGGFIVFVVGLLSNNNNKLVPNSWSIALESIYATVHSIVVGQINEKNGQAYFPFMYVLFVFILFNNLIGLVPYSFASTGHFALTFSLSFTIVLGATILGFSIHGLKFFSLLVPAGCPLALLPLLVLIEFISYLARNVSLGLRLAANILSGHMLLNILSGFTYNIMTSGFIFFFLGLLPLAFIVAFSGLELGIAFIQAQVFVVLSCSYIKDGLDLH